MSTEEIILLREIRDELRALRLATERRHGGQQDQQKGDLAEHLHTLAGVVEGCIFSVNEILAHAARPGGELLRASIIAMAGALNGRRLGKLLRAIEGKIIGGLRVERVGIDRLGAMWMLRECESETRKPAALVASRNG